MVFEAKAITYRIMAYELHIEGVDRNENGEPMHIALADWKAACSATTGVRLCAETTHTITNPKTGEVISIPRRDGDAEVYFSDESMWHAVFNWFDGAAHFNARFEPGDSSHPVWRAAVALSSCLGAAIRGDDGERYDLQTGEVIGA